MCGRNMSSVCGNNHKPRSKNFSKNFQKTLDKLNNLCYNLGVRNNGTHPSPRKCAVFLLISSGKTHPFYKKIGKEATSVRVGR